MILEFNRLRELSCKKNSKNIDPADFELRCSSQETAHRERRGRGRNHEVAVKGMLQTKFGDKGGPRNEDQQFVRLQKLPGRHEKPSRRFHVPIAGNDQHVAAGHVVFDILECT